MRAGTLPSWPSRAGLEVVVGPGTSFCGPIPEGGPTFKQRLGPGPDNFTAVTSLPACGKEGDAELLLALKATFTNGEVILASWNGSDPCRGWEGVACNTDARVHTV